MSKFNPAVVALVQCVCCLSRCDHREVLVSMPCPTHGTDNFAGIVCTNCGVFTSHEGVLIDVGFSGGKMLMPAYYDARDRKAEDWHTSQQTLDKAKDNFPSFTIEQDKPKDGGWRPGPELPPFI